MQKDSQVYEKMPGHWLLSSLGKTVLRPGGLEMTRAMLSGLNITEVDYVVEFAPGLGITAKMTLTKNPTYIAIEKDEKAAQIVRSYLDGIRQTCILGSAEDTGLPEDSATIVYGEAMLTMQSAKQKKQIVGEARRILKPGGKYAIHEMCLFPEEINSEQKGIIRSDLVEAIKVNASPLTVKEWKEVLEQQGFKIIDVQILPMDLLRLKRMIEDESVMGVMKITKNVLMNRHARKRVLKMRNTFLKHKSSIQAVLIIAELSE